MQISARHKVIVSAEPALLSASLGAWLAMQPDLDVVVDPSRRVAAAATSREVVVTTSWMACDAPLVLIETEANRLIVFTGQHRKRQAYRGLDDLYALIKQQQEASGEKEGQGEREGGRR